MELKELPTALAKAQGQIQAAKKTSENPAFSRPGKKSTYADIAEVIEVIQKPASDNGLSVIFDYTFEGEMLFINYVLMHSSGESMVGSKVPMFLRDKTLHGFGASNTFMRRQLLKSIYQIPEDDDDGNAGSKPVPPKGPPIPIPKPRDIPNMAPKLNPQNPQTYQPETFFDPPPEDDDSQLFQDEPPQKELTTLQKIIEFKNKKGMTNDQISDAIFRTTGHQSSKDCSDDQLKAVLKYLEMKT